MSYELVKDSKPISDFEGVEPDYDYRLELYDPRENHNKFWHIAVYGHFVVRHWGRHGGKGQSSVHRAWNDWGARGAAENLARSKQAKGYVKDQTTVLDHIVRKIV